MPFFLVMRRYRKVLNLDQIGSVFFVKQKSRARKYGSNMISCRDRYLLENSV